MESTKKHYNNNNNKDDDYPSISLKQSITYRELHENKILQCKRKGKIQKSGIQLTFSSKRRTQIYKVCMYVKMYKFSKGKQHFYVGENI